MMKKKILSIFICLSLVLSNFVLNGSAMVREAETIDENTFDLTEETTEACSEESITESTEAAETACELGETVEPSKESEIEETEAESAAPVCEELIEESTEAAENEIEAVYEETVETKTIKPKGMTASVDDGSGLDVYVEGAIPENTILRVKTVAIDTLQDAKAFMDEKLPADEGDKREYYAMDLSFLNKEGEEVEPDGQVTVSLSGLPIGAKVNVLHIIEKNDEITEQSVKAAPKKLFAAAPAKSASLMNAGPSEDSETVKKEALALGYELITGCVNEFGVLTFDADSFSTFLFTVDFTFDGFTYSIAGGSEISLSELFGRLGIDKAASDAVSVIFSDETLIEVMRLEDGSDWILKSLMPFDADELLTITFSDGEVLEISVADLDLSLPVWVYKKATDTEPSGTYDTVREAFSLVNSGTAYVDAVIELHGDVTETFASVTYPTYNVTLRSEPGVNHTVSYSNLSDKNTAAIRMNNNRKVTLGGGEGYGVLTLDLCGTGFGVLVTNGTLITQSGIVIKNGNSEYGNGGGAICITSSANSPKVIINGGVFENNAALKGGAIACNSNSTLTINGGTFIGNKATEENTEQITPYGNAVYAAVGRAVNISGSPLFGDDQDIYLPAVSKDSYAYVVKAGTIEASYIPVRLGLKIKTNSNTNIFEVRDILRSGTGNDVTESDLEKFVIINHEDVDSLYLKLGYNDSDKALKKPVLELVPAFSGNYDNFIDDDYDTPPGDKRGKTARWLDAEKTQAEILIDESSSEKDVLVIGSLCDAHELTSSTIQKVITEAAKYNNVDYFFESMTAGAPSQFGQDPSIAGVVRGPVSGTVLKGQKCTKTFNVYSGAHNATGYMAIELADRLQKKRYSEIIYVFDNITITALCYKALTPEEQTAAYQAANLLVPYYEAGKVIWVSAGKKVMWRDYDSNPKETYSVNVDPNEKGALLLQGSYTTDESRYHYDISHVTKDATTQGKYDVFNTFFAMALFDPKTWLEGVENNRIPEWSEYTINEEGILYKELGDIENYVGKKFLRDEIVINDVVDPELPINTVYLESSTDGGVTWKDITNEENVTITVEGQKVSAILKNVAYIDTNIRLRIVCDCPGEFKIDDETPKDTNIGNAEIVYLADGEEKITYELISPKLLKVFPRSDLTITKIADKLFDENDSFVFHVVGGTEKEPVDLYVTVPGTGSVTIKDLPISSYSITEETDWSWRYTPDKAEKEITLVKDASENEVFFTNELKKEQWLGGSSYAINRSDEVTNSADD